MSKEISQSSQQNPPRAQRTKLIPQKLQSGVDRQIPGLGVVIPEAAPSDPRKRAAPSTAPSSASKRKKVAEPSKEQSKKAAVPRKPRSKRATTSVVPSSDSSESSSGSSDTESGESTPVMANALEEIKLHKTAPEGFVIDDVPLSPAREGKFKDLYTVRNFCAVVSVDLESVYRECNVDLSPWFGPYTSFISIEAAYFPDLVKLFYFSMESANIVDSNGTLLEERVTCTVKGVKFLLTASILNRILKVTNPPPATTPTYTNEEVYSTLVGTEIPDDQRMHLSFKPSDMPQKNRIIWYIYSRNFVQKGGSYTHLSPKDYRFFTAFVRKHPFNIGKWILKEMIQFRFASRKTSYIPFPSLVSLILFYQKIWYVGPPESMKFIPAFGKNQFNFMKIPLEPEGSGQSRAPQRSRPRASQSVAQEAQSAPPPPPSDFAQRVREIVDAALVSHTLVMQTEFQKHSADFKLGLMDVLAGQNHLIAQLGKIKEDTEKKQDEFSDHLFDLDAKLSSTWHTACTARDNIDKLIKHFDLGASSSTFGFTTAPSSSTSVPEVQPSIPVTQPPETHFSPPSSPSFSFPSPPHTTSSPASTSTPATVVLSSPSTPATVVLSSPHTPATEIFPDPPPSPPTPTTEIFNPSPSTEVFDPNFDPSTAMVIYRPPIVCLDPEYVDDDDKGGEREKDV